MFSASTSNWLNSLSMNTYIGSAKYEYVASFLSSCTTSNFSSARYTVSVPLPDSRFLSFIFTTDALRPDFENSAFCTTIGSLPTMMTLPARTSCAVFMTIPGAVAWATMTARPGLNGEPEIIAYLRQKSTSCVARSGCAASDVGPCDGVRTQCRQRVAQRGHAAAVADPSASLNAVEKSPSASRASPRRGRACSDRGTPRASRGARAPPADRCATRTASPPTARARTSPRRERC